MAMSHHHPVVPASKEQSRCAFMFCLTWVGFFVVVGAIAWCQQFALGRRRNVRTARVPRRRVAV